jgi:transcriptional regulator with XRE-family HTH domain
MNMLIGERLRAIREAKKLSQGDVEHRTGLLRAYISRVGNGHTVPAVETLEKFARALGVPTYQLFYEGSETPTPPPRPRKEGIARGSTGKEARELERFRSLLAKMADRRRGLLFSLAQRLAQRRNVS